MRTKKVQLERLLESLEPLPDPVSSTEQYATPAGIAAEVAYLASMQGDIVDRSVVDLGTGNGVLAIAAKALGASRVIGIDADSKAIEVARRNAETAKLEVEWRVSDVRTLRESYDTILMNPPFGSQTRHADRPFFETALAGGRVVYTFLNANSEAFVRDLVASLGGRITDRIAYAFPVRHTFPFHREPSHNVDVVLYRMETAKG